MSERAVRLAAWLADLGTRDKIKCISVCDNKSTSRKEALDHVQNGEKILDDLGLGRFKVPGEVLTPASDSSVVDTLNKAATGGHLVMGTSGERRAGKGKATADPVFVGSVSLQCMATCSAPVILCKPKGTPKLDKTQGMQLRAAGKTGTVIVVAVDGGHISQKCFDMALRFVKVQDDVYIVHVRSSDQNVMRPGAVNSLLGDSAVAKYYEGECAKAGDRFPNSSFQFVPLQLQKASIVETILGFCDSDDILADLIIMGSVELGKAGIKQGKVALGSVSAAIARRTPAHILIAKHFAT